MRNAMIALATLLVGVSLGLPSFAAAWATPGAACTQEGANANSDGFLTCTGGVWVSNAVLLGTTSATCDSTKAGYIRYTGGQFEGCNGTGWIQLAGGGAPTYLGVTPTTYNGNLGGYTGANAKCVTAFGTGARMMSLSDAVRLGRATNYSASGWIDCRAEMSAWVSTYLYYTCGEAVSYGDQNSDCSKYTWTGSTTNSAFNITATGNVSTSRCNIPNGIHCVKD